MWISSSSQPMPLSQATGKFHKSCRDRNPQQSPQVTRPLPPTLSCPLATTIKIDKLQAYLEGYPSRPRKFFSKRVMNWSFQWLQRKQSAPASCCHLRVLSLILRTWKHSFLATNLCTSQWKTPHPHTRGMWGISEGILAIFSGHLCPGEQGVQQHQTKKTATGDRQQGFGGDFAFKAILNRPTKNTEKAYDLKMAAAKKKVCMI